MRWAASFLVLALIAAPVAASSRWTAVGAGNHDVSWRGGAGTLTVAGTFGGTTVTFFYCPPHPSIATCFEIDATNCTFTAAGFCDFSKGPGDLRLTVTGGTPTIDAVAAGPTQAAISTGGGATGFDALTGGTNTTAAMLVGTGASMGISGTGTIAASSIDADGDGNPEIAFVSPNILRIDPNSDGTTAYDEIENASNFHFTFDSATRQLFFDQGGTDSFRFQNVLGGGGSGLFSLSGGAVRNVAPSSTAPTLIPLGSVTNTGVGRDSTSGDLHLIETGVSAMSASTEGVQVADGLRFEFPEATTPPTVTESGSFWETDENWLCVYDGVQQQCMGQVHGDLSGTTGTITLSTEDTYVQWTDATAGPSNAVTASATTDDLVLDYAGDYHVQLDTSFSASVNDTITCNVHEDGSPGTVFFVRKMGTGGDVGAASASGRLTLAASAVLEVFCKNDVGDGAGSITINRFALMVQRL